MTKSKNEKLDKCTNKKNVYAESNSTNGVMKTMNIPETITEPADDDESTLFYESVTNFLADYQNKTITDEFYLAVEVYELHYYIATAIRLIMSTRSINVYEESIILNDAIDLLVRWREYVKDNKSIQFVPNDPMTFADVAFSDPHDKRHIAIGLIIKAVITPDNDLCDIYLDAAISLLNECIIPGTDHLIERDR
jgi:hypothetical protein